MEDEDEEDDSHYCLKCRQTIHGLDSYVKHRRERECQARASSPLISANDFFLSLNLMSNHPVVGDVLCSDLLGEEEPSHHTSSNPSKKLNLLSFLKDDPIPEDLPDFIHEEEEVVERGQGTPGLDELLLLPSPPRHSPLPLLDTCPSCRAPVQAHQIGKHLISHYHHHHIPRHPRAKTENKALVLQYIADIVKEAPYQCMPCRFYCNWHQELAQHWQTTHNSESLLQPGEQFWCSFCRFRARSGGEMLEHLNSAGHLEIVSVINRSVPIILRKTSLLSCEICGENFRLRIAHKKHMANAHPSSSSSSSGSEEDCEFCSRVFLSREEVRAHVLEAHSRLCSQCALCGLRFPRPQDLGVHVRNKACNVFKKEEERVAKGEFTCELCPGFNCDSLTMLRFHCALKHSPHDDPLRAICPMCTKEFPKTKLWQHLKVHDPGKTTCDNCYRVFLSVSELSSHSKTCHSSQNSDFKCSKCSYTTKKKLLRDLHFKRNHTTPKPIKATKDYSQNPCTLCDACFPTSSELRSHYLSHSSDKPLVCSLCGIFKAKRISEINRHQRSKHGKLQHLKTCGQCSYSTISSQHLQRHIKAAHATTIDFFRCRICSFKCATLENLRKHILKTKIHPENTPVYICDFCSEFRNNSAAEYGKHLLKVHEMKDFKNKVKNYFFKDSFEQQLSV